MTNQNHNHTNKSTPEPLCNRGIKHAIGTYNGRIHDDPNVWMPHAIRAFLDSRVPAQTTFTNGPIHMDTVTRITTLHGTQLDLSPKEYDMLRYFLQNKGRVMSNAQILKGVWGPAYNETEHVQYVRVFLTQLRKHIEPTPSKPTILRLVRGHGYIMENLDPSATSINNDTTEQPSSPPDEVFRVNQGDQPTN